MLIKNNNNNMATSGSRGDITIPRKEGLVAAGPQGARQHLSPETAPGARARSLHLCLRKGKALAGGRCALSPAVTRLSQPGRFHPPGWRSLPGPGARTRGTPARLPRRRPHGLIVSDWHTGHRGRSQPGSGAGTKERRARGHLQAGAEGDRAERGPSSAPAPAPARPSKPPFFSISPGSAPGTAGRGRSERSPSPGPPPPPPREAHKERGPASARLPSGRGGGRGVRSPAPALKDPPLLASTAQARPGGGEGWGAHPASRGWRGGPRSREGQGTRGPGTAPSGGGRPGSPRCSPILGFGCTVSGRSGRGDGTAGGRARVGTRPGGCLCVACAFAQVDRPRPWPLGPCAPGPRVLLCAPPLPPPPPPHRTAVFIAQ